MPGRDSRPDVNIESGVPPVVHQRDALRRDLTSDQSHFQHPVPEAYSVGRTVIAYHMKGVTLPGLPKLHDLQDNRHRKLCKIISVQSC